MIPAILKSKSKPPERLMIIITRDWSTNAKNGNAMAA
jgi:hypothetical protein